MELRTSKRFIHRPAVRLSVLFLFFTMMIGLLPTMNGTTEASPWDDPANLIVNPSYESVTNGFPNGWGKFVPTGTPEITADSAAAHDGSVSLRIHASATARGDVNQWVSVTEGVYYDLSMWIKTANIESNDLGATVRLQFFNNSGGQTRTNLIVWNWKGTNDWMKVAYRFQTPPGTVKILIENFLWNATGTVWFDDVKLAKSGYLTGMVSQEHPRLLAKADDFAGMKQRIQTDPQIATWYQGVKAAADKILTDPVSKYVKSPVGSILDVSSQVVSRMYKLGLVYRIDGSPLYAERAWKELEAVSAFPDWNPVNFLDTAEMTHGAAIGYDWFYDYWSAQRKKVILDTIAAKGLNPGLNEYKTGWWPSSDNNWNLVCNAGLTAGALVVTDDPAYGLLAEDILRNSLESIRAGMKPFAPDGGWFEGYGYWNYGTQYLTLYLAELHSAMGTDFGLSNQPGISETGFYPIYMEGPEQVFNYGEAYPGVNPSPQLFWMAQHFNQPELQWARYSMAESPQSLLWYRPTSYPGPRAGGLPRDRYFTNVDVATMRSAWEDKLAVFAGIKGAVVPVSHKQMDAGEFVLDALGVRWATLLGPDDYSLPGYFDSRHWTYYRNRAEGSNTLVINPGSGLDQDVNKAAPITEFHSNLESAYAIADVQPVYGSKVTKAERGIKLFDQRRQVLIQDEVETGNPSDIWWFMHTVTDVDEISPDGKTAILSQNGKRLWARILSPQGEFTVMDALPMPSSPDPAGQNPNAGVKKLTIHVPHTSKLQLSVLMVPLREWEQPPTTLPDMVPLSQWSQSAEQTSLLSGITLDGQPLQGFAQDTFTYDLTYTPNETIPAITAAAADPAATVKVTQAPGIPGTAWVEVRNPGASDVTRYAVHFNSRSVPVVDSLSVQSVTASVSSTDDSNVPENTLDHNLDTRWSAEGKGQWIQYDLGSETPLRSVSIAWYKGNERKETFDIVTSNDGKAWETRFSGKSSGANWNLENYSIGDVSARYVRIIGYGNSVSLWNSITEVRIYDRLVEMPQAPVRLASVSLASEASELYVGDTRTLKVTGVMSDGSAADLAQADVSFYSSDPNVIQVDPAGVVQAVREGTAKLSVMATKDRFAKKASLTLTVKDKNKQYPIQDTFVQDGTLSNTNFGTEAQFLVKEARYAGTNRVAYLKFDLSRILPNPSRVYLNVYGAVRDGGGTEVDMYVHKLEDDSWTETGVTWNNRPAAGAEIAKEHFDSIPNWHRMEVTDYVKEQALGDGTASMALQQTGVGYALFLNSRENTSNKPYLSFEYDGKAPVTEVTYSPSQPDGLNGWYVHPVTVSLSAHDDRPGVITTVYSRDGGALWQPYVGPVTLDQSGIYAMSYRSTDQAGNAEAARTLYLNVDMAGPEISVSVTQSNYSDSDDLTPKFTVTDDMSGVDPGRTVMTLDGQLLQQGTAVPLYTLPLGFHSLTITAEDRAGNRSNQTVTFETVASIQSLQNLVNRFAAKGWIDNRGIANSLLKKLNANQVESFKHEVEAQAGKHISAEAANFLLRDVRALMN